MIETPHEFHKRIAPRSVALLDYALKFATQAHEGQVRKYSGEPYIAHPMNVARIVAEVTCDVNMICAAYLHDTVEDTDVTLDEIATSGFGGDVARLVEMLTDVSVPADGNRKRRKAIDRHHTGQASKQGKTIKLADLLDNTCSITRDDPNFAKVYMAEKSLLLTELRGGDQFLWDMARMTVAIHEDSLLQEALA